MRVLLLVLHRKGRKKKMPDENLVGNILLLAVLVVKHSKTIKLWKFILHRIQKTDHFLVKTVKNVSRILRH